MKHLAIYGKTGVGKTQTLFRELKKKKGRKILFLRSLEELYKLTKDPSYTDIIFDDISFENSRPELLIHLCDRDFPSPVRILRQIVEIPPKTNKWFTHNNVYAFQPILASIEQQAAINRRLDIVEVSSREQIRQLIK